LPALLVCGLLLQAVSGCSDLNWPFHRATSSAAAAPADSGSDTECDDIRAQIRDAQEARREAPTTTTNSDIMNAAQAKADKRIDDLRQRSDALDCPDEPDVSLGRQPPLQPAPGGGSR
jgi:hypothetical protein